MKLTKILFFFLSLFNRQDRKLCSKLNLQQQYSYNRLNELIKLKYCLSPNEDTFVADRSSLHPKTIVLMLQSLHYSIY